MSMGHFAYFSVTVPNVILYPHFIPLLYVLNSHCYHILASEGDDFFKIKSEKKKFQIVMRYHTNAYRDIFLFFQ